MTNQEVENAAFALAERTVSDMGAELCSVEYGMDEGVLCLSFFIWKKEGVSLDDCERISAAIDALLEQNDVTDGGQYCLCVSSPGERPLKSDRDLERNIGSKVTVETNTKKRRGVLVSFDAQVVVIAEKKQEARIERENIKTIKPYIGF